jgi:hypothetical protein
MQTFTLSHEIHCDEATFWKVFFSKGFNEALFREFLGFPHYEIVEQKETDDAIVRRVKVTPKMEAPGAVQKALGSSFSYLEEGTLDKTTKVYRWKSTPSTLAEKVTTEGTVRAEPGGAGNVRRLCDFRYEARIFGIGGLLESALEKSLKNGWDRSAGFFNQWLADKKHETVT